MTLSPPILNHLDQEIFGRVVDPSWQPVWQWRLFVAVGVAILSW